MDIWAPFKFIHIKNLFWTLNTSPSSKQTAWCCNSFYLMKYSPPWSQILTSLKSRRGFFPNSGSAWDAHDYRPLSGRGYSPFTILNVPKYQIPNTTRTSRHRAFELALKLDGLKWLCSVGFRYGVSLVAQPTPNLFLQGFHSCILITGRSLLSFTCTFLLTVSSSQEVGNSTSQADDMVLIGL